MGMKQKRQAIIFDCNGTVADTEHVRFSIAKRLLSEHGICLSHEQERRMYQELLGATLLRASEYIVCTFHLNESVQTLTKKQAELLINTCKTEVEYVPGFLPFIEKVKKRGVVVALASNSSKALLGAISDKLNLYSLFQDRMYDISCVVHPKPAPDIYLFTAQQLKADVSVCIAIEDSACGVEAAVKAGMLCVGLSRTQSKNDVKGAHIVVANYDDINLDYILSL